MKKKTKTRPRRSAFLGVSRKELEATCAVAEDRVVTLQALTARQARYLETLIANLPDPNEPDERVEERDATIKELRIQNDRLHSIVIETVEHLLSLKLRATDSKLNDLDTRNGIMATLQEHRANIEARERQGI